MASPIGLFYILSFTALWELAFVANQTDFNLTAHHQHHRHNNHQHLLLLQKDGESTDPSVKPDDSLRNGTNLLRVNTDYFSDSRRSAFRRKKGRKASRPKCTHSGFMRCLNLGNPFEISELIAGVGVSSLVSLPVHLPNSTVQIGGKDALRRRLRRLCAATTPIVKCLSRSSCLVDSLSFNAPVWKSVFSGAQGQQARIFPNWVKSLRYLPIACNLLVGRTPKYMAPLKGMDFRFNSLDKCPLVTRRLFREECGSSDQVDMTSLDGVIKDPWNQPAAFNSGVSLQWIDFQFLDLLKADEKTGQVNFSALPVIADTGCVYLNKKVDCFAVQVYRYCPRNVQDSIIASLLKFMNFQLMVSQSECTPFSENPDELRRVLDVVANKYHQSLSFVDVSLDKQEGTDLNSNTTQRPGYRGDAISVTLADDPTAQLAPTAGTEPRDDMSSLIRHSNATLTTGNCLDTLTFCIAIFVFSQLRFSLTWRLLS